MIAGISLALAGCMAEVEPVGSSSAAVSRGVPACFEGECVPETVPIYAGRHIEIGTASVVSSGDELLVTIETTGGWTFGLVHLYAGVDPAPTNRAGAPVPGRFPYHYRFPAGATSTTIAIPLVGAACGDTLTVAVHLEAHHPDRGSETGWAFGEPFARGWGWYFRYDMCCEGTGACVMPPEFWRDNTAQWPPYITKLGIGPNLYEQGEIVDLLSLDPSEDASLRLAQAWIGLKLNWYCGVDVSDPDWEVMLRAGSWFYRNMDADGRLPYGVDPASAAGLEAIALAEVLEAFNAGASTAPACPESLY